MQYPLITSDSGIVVNNPEVVVMTASGTANYGNKENLDFEIKFPDGTVKKLSELKGK
jgi:ABC-type hemin transport system substrate-binding protein